MDTKLLDRWKRQGPSVVSDPVSTYQSVIEPLIAEVERLRARLAVREAPSPEEYVDLLDRAMREPPDTLKEAVLRDEVSRLRAAPDAQGGAL